VKGELSLIRRREQGRTRGLVGNVIAGLIAVVLISAFLLFYAVTLKTLPLWIIIVGVLALVVLDFVQSVKKGKDETED
jgi:MFS superfamily sulfate permease-like transporter